MEVIVLPPSSDFDSITTSPPRFTDQPPYYFSAPVSPSHIAQFYKHFEDLLGFDDEIKQLPAVPFAWEDKPGIPKWTSVDEDFAFDVSEEWETAPQSSAEELFDGGVIKPLKPPPAMLQQTRIGEGRVYSPTFSRARSRRKISIGGAFSPRGKGSKLVVDPFSSGARNAAAEAQRGREKGANVNMSSRRAARSLSPIRDGEYQWKGKKQQPSDVVALASTLSGALRSSLSGSAKGSRKWRLVDFFLFRSASEGRADEKDQLKKYTAAFRHSSFRTVDIPGQESGSRRGPVSAHELHYTMNRAVSQDLKKKTFLPYKQGILGRLAFNPAVHALANGFGFSR